MTFLHVADKVSNKGEAQSWLQFEPLPNLATTITKPTNFILQVSTVVFKGIHYTICDSTKPTHDRLIRSPLKPIPQTVQFTVHLHYLNKKHSWGINTIAANCQSRQFS